MRRGRQLHLLVSEKNSVDLNGLNIRYHRKGLKELVLGANS